MVVYFDNAATTKLAPEVASEIDRVNSLTLGNASSNHALGFQAAKIVEQARMKIARAIGAEAEEILFTSSGTESNNLAIKGYAFANRSERNHIIMSAIEHACVAGAVEWLGRQGFRVSTVGVDGEGQVDHEQLLELLTPDTLLVSIMHANNEIGSIQDLHAIAKLCESKGVALHSDCVQSFMKVPIDVHKTPVAMLTLSSHKIHGPRGVAALYVRKGVEIEPLLHGGGQERNLRSGTLNVEGIAGFAKAADVFHVSHLDQMRELSNELKTRVRERIPRAVINGPESGGLSNIVNMSLPGFTSKQLIRDLQKKEIFVSAGSACLSQKATGSFVVRALGHNEERVQSALRISLSRFTKREEITLFVEALEEIVSKGKSL